MPGKKPSFWDKYQSYKAAEEIYNPIERSAGDALKEKYNSRLDAFLGSAYVYDSQGDSLTLSNREELMKTLDKMPKKDDTGIDRNNFMFLREPKEPGSVYLLRVTLDPSGHRQLELSDHPVTDKEFDEICCRGSFIDKEMNKPKAPGWGDWFANLWSRLLGRGQTETYRKYEEAKEYYELRVNSLKESVGLKKPDKDGYVSFVADSEQKTWQEKDVEEKREASKPSLSRDEKLVQTQKMRIVSNVNAKSLGYTDGNVPKEHLDAFLAFGEDITEIANQDEAVRFFLTGFGKENMRILYGAYRTAYNNQNIMDVKGMLSDAVHKKAGEAGQSDLELVVKYNQRVQTRTVSKEKVDSLTKS